MTTAQAIRRFEMVAVPQAKPRPSSSTSYALGVRSAQRGAAYVIGADGPQHMPIEKLYFAAGDKEFEVDLVAETLTVADKSKMRVTIYPVDIKAMNGHVIEHGETFTVVLADAARTERPLKVNRWVAATAPTFERETLPDYVTATDDLAVSISATIEEASLAGHVKMQTFDTTAPAVETRSDVATKEPIVDLRSLSAPGAPNFTTTHVVDIRTGSTPEETSEEIVDEPVDEFEIDGSVEVVVPDPVTGAHYQGRQWRKDRSRKDALTLAALRAHDYRVVVLEMDEGQSATIALNDANGLPMMSIVTRPGNPPTERYLTEQTWNERFGPGTSFEFTTQSTLDGSPAPENARRSSEKTSRKLSTPAISRVTATSDLIREMSHARGETTDALTKHRKLLVAQSKRREHTNDYSLSRGISHRS